MSGNNITPITTVREMLLKLEEEIAAAKSGQLPLETARVVLKGRDLQLKAAQLNVQHTRLQRHQQRLSKAIDRNILTGELITQPEPAENIPVTPTADVKPSS